MCICRCVSKGVDKVCVNLTGVCMSNYMWIMCVSNCVDKEYVTYVDKVCV